jgi:hypothetical protein
MALLGREETVITGKIKFGPHRHRLTKHPCPHSPSLRGRDWRVEENPDVSPVARP